MLYRPRHGRISIRIRGYLTNRAVQEFTKSNAFSLYNALEREILNAPDGDSKAEKHQITKSGQVMESRLSPLEEPRGLLSSTPQSPYDSSDRRRTHLLVVP